MFGITRIKAFALIAVLIGGALLWNLDIRAGLFSDNALRPTQIKGEGFPKTLTDPIGEEYLLQDIPERIVSVTLGTDEILSALVDSDRIQGVTNLVDDAGISNVASWYPDRIKRIRAEVEEILALEPDLVFVAGYSRAETVRLLLGAGIPVVRLTRYGTFGDIEENIRTVARVTGSERRASAILEGLRQEVEELKNRVSDLPRPRVLYYNLSGYTAGRGATIDEMVQLAGGYNVVRETGIQGNHKISEELAIGLEPDVILMSGWSPGSETTPAELLMQLPAWQNVPAVLNDRVYSLRGAWVLSVSQHSWKGIGKISALLHPEAFK